MLYSLLAITQALVELSSAKVCRRKIHQFIESSFKPVTEPAKVEGLIFGHGPGRTMGEQVPHESDLETPIIDVGGGASRPALVRRGLRLTYATIGYNCLEGLVAIGAGVVAGSIALVGFGLDSSIEVSASGQFKGWQSLAPLSPPAAARAAAARFARVR